MSVVESTSGSIISALDGSSLNAIVGTGETTTTIFGMLSSRQAVADVSAVAECVVVVGDDVDAVAVVVVVAAAADVVNESESETVTVAGVGAVATAASVAVDSVDWHTSGSDAVAVCCS